MADVMSTTYATRWAKPSIGTALRCVKDDERRLERLSELPWALADPDDTAGINHIELAASRFGHELVTLGARIHPDLADALSLQIVEQRHHDVRLDVHRCHVDRPWHVDDGGIGPQPFDFPLVRVDRHDGVSLGTEGAEGLVTKLLAIAGGTDNGNGLHCLRYLAFNHDAGWMGGEARAPEDGAGISGAESSAV